MVGHESVDPKPQEKSDLVYWRDSTTYQTLHTFLSFLRERRKAKVVYSMMRRWVKAKGNPVLIPEPGCGYVREKRNLNPRFSRSR